MFINSSSQNHEEFNGILDAYGVAENGGGFIRRSTFDKTSIIVNQLLGEHKFSERTVFDWGISYNTLTNDCSLYKYLFFHSNQNAKPGDGNFFTVISKANIIFASL